MTSPRARHRTVTAPARRLLGTVPAFVTRLRREPPPEPVTLVGLVALSLLLLLLAVRIGNRWLPPSVQAVPLLGGGLLLGRRGFRQLVALVTIAVVLTFLIEDSRSTPPGSVLVVVVAAFVGYEFARSRDETGLGGSRGDSVLVELRRRLELQGALPRLPAPWSGEAVVSPAGGGPFSGDFVVSALTGEARFEVALVDVSGKGVDAGTRSLLLSGAMGGLLGSRAPGEFLEAANSYLIRQDWDEGFATAVHVTVDLPSGTFCITSAGHPPVAHFVAGSGRWGLIEAGGPALGLLPDTSYDGTTGTLDVGDALLLYTDGLVEVPGRDLSVGIDKLLGMAERVVTRGFVGGGRLLVDGVADGSSDDRGLVLLWRSR